MGRAPCCEKEGLKRGRWTAEEDEKLVRYIAASGEGSWRSLPKNAGLLRCGKSCRLRWKNYLRSDLKRGDISMEEEETIIKLHASLGKRWSLIAGHLPGRTDNEIKNYWNSHLSRRLHSFRRNGTAVAGDVGKPAGGGKRTRGGRTSRSAMKKNHNSTGVIIRGEKQEKGGSLPTSTPAQSDGGSSTVLDFEDGLMSPSQVEEVGLFLSGEDSGGWGSHEERESGVLSSSCEEREGGGLVLNEGREGEQPLGVAAEGGVGALGEEEVGSDRMEEMLQLDLEGMEAELWDEAGELWPWLWELEGVLGYL